MTSLLARLFGHRRDTQICQGKTAYNPEYELLCTEFLDPNKAPWPSRYATTLLKSRLQPMLSEPSFHYPSEQVMVKARDLTLQLWTVALERLANNQTNHDGVEEQRLLETLILSIAQRDEFRVEFLGWRKNTKNTKNTKNNKNNKNSKNSKKNNKKNNKNNKKSNGSSKKKSNTTSKNKSQSGPVGIHHHTTHVSLDESSLSGGKTSKTLQARPSSIATSSVAHSKTASPRLLHTFVGPRPPRSGHFNPKEEKSLDHGKMYCRCLGKKMTTVTVCRYLCVFL